MLLTIELGGRDAAANLAYEEALFHALRGQPRPVALFYVNDPCVVLGRGNSVEQWIDAAACAADGVPVLRRFSGGGTVYHDGDNLNYSFCLPRSWLDAAARPGSAPLRGGEMTGAGVCPTGIQRYIGFFRRLVIDALERGSGQGGYTESGVSDISLNGAKVSGNAQRIAADIVLHHGTLMLRCPLSALERYLPVPPNRPGVPHRGFVSGLHEQGRTHSLDELRGWLATEFARRVDALR